MSSLISNMKVTKTAHSIHTLRGFGYHHMWYQNWCQCLNLIMSIYFLWTFHSPGIWFFDNRHLLDNLTSFDILLPHHLYAPLLMGTGVMRHMGNVAYPPSRSTWGQDNGVHGQKGTWETRHMSTRGRVMGHMGDGNGKIEHIAIIMHRSRWGQGWWGTWAMGHIVDVFSEFSEYIHWVCEYLPLRC